MRKNQLEIDTKQQNSVACCGFSNLHVAKNLRLKPIRQCKKKINLSICDKKYASSAQTLDNSTTLDSILQYENSAWTLKPSNQFIALKSSIKKNDDYRSQAPQIIYNGIRQQQYQNPYMLYQITEANSMMQATSTATLLKQKISDLRAYQILYTAEGDISQY